MLKYSIGEMAQKLDKSVKTLQRWDRDGILAASRSSSNRRYYTHNQYLEISNNRKYMTDQDDNLDIVRDKVVLITGGTGSLGYALTRRICDVAKKIIIYSRCELRQAQMQNKFSDKHNIRFIIGDVRDKSRLNSCMREVDVCIHCASMKRIEQCSYNPTEAIKTIVFGTMNVMESCIENDVSKVLFVSTDKSCMPATLYGGSKFVAEQLITAGNNLASRNTILTTTRYGNVYSSNGSMRHLFKKQFEDTGRIKITHEDMTRFIMTLDDAVDLNLFALSNSKCGGEIFIPKLKSIKIIDYAKIFFPDAPVDIIGLRGYEKIHEDLISDTEMRYVVDLDNYFKIIPPDIGVPGIGWDGDYPAEKCVDKPFKYNSSDVERLTNEEILKMEGDCE